MWLAATPHWCRTDISARKAHPAFAVANLEELRETLLAQGFVVIDDENLPGRRRFYSEDPWGNRIEFLETKL